MPIQSCSKNGARGYKYGESGHCYTGKGAYALAAKQAAAIKESQRMQGHYENEKSKS